MVRASSFAKAVGLSALLLLNAPSPAHGQTVTIRGRVVDASTLEPIVDAIVAIKGDITTVAVTDSVGRYSIAIPRPDVTLTFSALGFAEQESAPGGRTVVNTTLVRGPVLMQDLRGTLPCDGAALRGPSALDPPTPPRQMPAPDNPSAPIPNACAVPAPGNSPTR